MRNEVLELFDGIENFILCHKKETDYQFWKMEQNYFVQLALNLVKVQNLDKVISEVEPTNDEIALSLAMTGRVYVNETQYFDHVPEIAWNFYIGGYQPAQKWLKDRKDRKLEFEDIAHYQKIIVALAETDRLMKEIDGIEIED